VVVALVESNSTRKVPQSPNSKLQALARKATIPFLALLLVLVQVFLVLGPQNRVPHGDAPLRGAVRVLEASSLTTWS
jgi:hypothetical protein